MTTAPLLQLVVWGRPQGARRHRASRRGERVVMHHDDQHIAAEDQVRYAAAQRWTATPLDQPVSLLIETWHKRPALGEPAEVMRTAIREYVATHRAGADR